MQMDPATNAQRDAHLVNRIGALALRIQDEVDAATERHRSLAASHPEALIALVNFADGDRPAALEQTLGLSQPGVAHLVAKLEAGGLVERRGDPIDARARRVHLTARGRRLAQAVLRDRGRAVERLLEPLHDAERQAMLDAVDTVLMEDTDSLARARRSCRSCDKSACDHPASCPVTLGADRWR